jgi:hypothetical protein
MKKTLEERVQALEDRQAHYGPIRLGGPCAICGRPSHGPYDCKEAETREHAAIRKLVATLNFQKLNSKEQAMGNFRVEIQAVGNHGCQREVKNGGIVEGCGQPNCVDCITRDYVKKLKDSGAYFSATGDRDTMGYAKLTHWPGANGTVHDDLLTRIRSGSF